MLIYLLVIGLILDMSHGIFGSNIWRFEALDVELIG
jgi:hypothetical protein